MYLHTSLAGQVCAGGVDIRRFLPYPFHLQVRSSLKPYATFSIGVKACLSTVSPPMMCEAMQRAKSMWSAFVRSGKNQ
jgi:hypothetical protein